MVCNHFASQLEVDGLPCARAPQILYVYMNECVGVCMYACMHVCMHVCMYVYI